MNVNMSLEQIRFALTVFLLQNEGKTVKETFNWIETKSANHPFEHNEIIDKEEFTFGLVSIDRNYSDVVTYHRYRFDITAGWCHLIITTKALEHGEMLHSVTLNLGDYWLKTEDIIKRINFKDTV